MLCNRMQLNQLVKHMQAYRSREDSQVCGRVKNLKCSLEWR